MNHIPKPSVFTSVSQYMSAARLEEKNRVYLSKPIRSQGKQVFEKKDLHGIINPIAILLRLIFIDNRISEEDFNEMHHQFKRDIGKTTAQINQDVGNLRKAFKSPRLTIDKLEEAIHICGFEVTDLSVTLKDKHTGVEKTYHSSDIENINIPTKFEDIIESIDDPEDDSDYE